VSGTFYCLFCYYYDGKLNFLVVDLNRKFLVGIFKKLEENYY